MKETVKLLKALEIEFFQPQKMSHNITLSQDNHLQINIAMYDPKFGGNCWQTILLDDEDLTRDPAELVAELKAAVG